MIIMDVCDENFPCLGLLLAVWVSFLPSWSSALVWIVLAAERASGASSNTTSDHEPVRALFPMPGLGSAMPGIPRSGHVGYLTFAGSPFFLGEMGGPQPWLRVEFGPFVLALFPLYLTA